MVQERGVVYKASVRAYLGNYIIGFCVLFLGLLIIANFGITFKLNPSGAGELLNTLVYAAFGIVAGFLFIEPFIEGFARHYIVSPSEVLKVEGILWKRRHAIPYQSISEIKVTKGLFGRIFNYGTVDVGGTHNESSITMKHVSNPYEIQRIIQHRVNSMRSALTQRRGPRGGKEDKEEDSLE